MNVFYLLFFFIIGLFFGSFFCCVGLRLAKGISFVKGHSKCDCCQHELKAKDLVPVFSYLYLRGKCRYCHKKISSLSTFIELFTALLFALSYYSFGFSLDLVLALLLVSMAMIIFSSDLTYLIIPDEVIIFFSITLVIVQFLRLGFGEGLLALVSGIVFFLFMFFLMKLGNHLFKKESLGGGDVKLAFIIGLVLDPFLCLVTIFLASLIALPISLYLLFKNKEHVIPFGPFILIGFFIIFFSKVTTSEIFTFFSSAYLI